jgi:hypothetical protein
LVEPRTDSVSVRVDHADNGGRVRVTDPRLRSAPKSTVRVWG